MPSKINDVQKKEIVALYNKGQLVSELCAQHNIPKSTLYHWIHMYSQIKSSLVSEVTMRDHVLMQRKLTRREMENRIFRESGCSVSSQLKEKVQEIKRLRSRFSVRALCDVLQVRRSTFYYYLFRSPELTQVAEQDIVLRERIAAIFEESQQRFGAKKIRVKLRQEGYQISERRIMRLMRETGLKCNRDKPVRKYLPENERQYYRNHLNREFRQVVPNRAWVGDITYCLVQGQKCYVSVVIDLFSRRVLAHEVSAEAHSSNVSAIFLEAYIQRNQPQSLMFYSDMGAQYTSQIFRQRLEILDVKQSFSRPGCSYDNAVVESFFASLKKEEIYRTPYENIGQLRAAVDAYVDFFNMDRPHQSLGYLTPVQAEKDYWGRK